ncbi:uncharacterized protein [Rhodnius prolixus]|uniref:uncharacterized protein n=1 Tax=Rhodnius prolixus TaxID=13249 RepID=UPI003D187960
MNQLFFLKYLICLLASINCSKGWEPAWLINPSAKVGTTTIPKEVNEVNDFPNITSDVINKFIPVNNIDQRENEQNYNEQEINDLALLIAQNYFKIPLQLFNLELSTQQLVNQKGDQNNVSILRH